MEGFQEALEACKSGQWVPISEEIYDYWLGVLPPMHWAEGMFLCEEAIDESPRGTIYYAFKCDRAACSYWMAVRTLRDFLTEQSARRAQRMPAFSPSDDRDQT